MFGLMRTNTITVLSFVPHVFLLSFAFAVVSLCLKDCRRTYTPKVALISACSSSGKNINNIDYPNKPPQQEQ